MIEIEDEDEIALRKALDLVPGRTEIGLALQDRRNAPGYARTTPTGPTAFSATSS